MIVATWCNSPPPSQSGWPSKVVACIFIMRACVRTDTVHSAWKMWYAFVIVIYFPFLFCYFSLSHLRNGRIWFIFNDIVISFPPPHSIFNAHITQSHTRTHPCGVIVIVSRHIIHSLSIEPFQSQMALFNNHLIRSQLLF